MDSNATKHLDKKRQGERKKASENLIEFLTQFMDFTTYGFKISYQNIERANPYVVFDSEWCRVSFTLDKEQLPKNDTLMVYYGRLHAPDLEYVLVWKSQPCRCWHQVHNALFFIDGFTPKEVIENEEMERIYPKAVEEFRKSAIGKKLFNEYPPKNHAALHKALWEHYGQRLFEVFDLRRPDIWEQYTQYIKEYYRLKGLKESAIPSLPRLDEIC